MPVVRERNRILTYIAILAAAAAFVFYLLYFTGPRAEDLFEEDRLVENLQVVLLLACLASCAWTYIRSLRSRLVDRRVQALLAIFFFLYLSKEVDLVRLVFGASIFSMRFYVDYVKYPWPVWAKMLCAMLYMFLAYAACAYLVRRRKEILRGFADWRHSLAFKLFVVAFSVAVLAQLFDMHVLALPVPYECDYEEALEFLSTVLFTFSCIENVRQPRQVS